MSGAPLSVADAAAVNQPFVCGPVSMAAIEPVFAGAVVDFTCALELVTPTFPLPSTA